MGSRLLQTGKSWMQSVAPKAHGAYNLDKATHGIDTLEHFVMWSSFVASAGNEGMNSSKHIHYNPDPYCSPTWPTMKNRTFFYHAMLTHPCRGNLVQYHADSSLYRQILYNPI